MNQNKVNYNRVSTTRPLCGRPGVTVICASSCFGHPHSQTLVKWASPSHITLAAGPTLRVLNLTKYNVLPFLCLQMVRHYILLEKGLISSVAYFLRTCVKFPFANKIEAMQEKSLVGVEVEIEPRPTSRLSSALFILPLCYLRD